MARSLLAILLGYLTFGVSAGLLFGLSGQDPHAAPGHGFLVGSVLYGVAFALAGGYLAAVVARRREALHGAAVAAIIGLLALVSLLVNLGRGAVWSEVSVLVLMVPAAALGGWLRQRAVCGRGPGG